jgi:hypothetical protein
MFGFRKIESIFVIPVVIIVWAGTNGLLSNHLAAQQAKRRPAKRVVQAPTKPVQVPVPAPRVSITVLPGGRTIRQEISNERPIVTGGKVIGACGTGAKPSSNSYNAQTDTLTFVWAATCTTGKSGGCPAFVTLQICEVFLTSDNFEFFVPVFTYTGAAGFTCGTTSTYTFTMNMLGRWDGDGNYCASAQLFGGSCLNQDAATYIDGQVADYTVTDSNVIKQEP